MAWILRLDISDADTEAMTEQLWMLGTNGVAEIEAEARLLAGFETEEAANAAAAELGGSVAPVDPSAWATPDTSTVQVAGQTLTIDAGHSFGHGAHPTTRLCLGALERHTWTGCSVLDVGCGSGVLSLAAKTLGARTVSAIDIDPAAIEATRSNAATNELRLEVSSVSIEQLAGPFDVTVVNMLVAELQPIAPDVRRVTSGLIIVSGGLIEQRDRWSGMFPGCDVVEETTDGDWAASVLRTND